MSTIGYRLARLSLLALAATWPMAIAAQPGPDLKPVRIVILVPEKATLYVDGNKTTATGTRRSFESPPVPVGKKYFYQVKAAWTGPDGKEIVREQHFTVRAGETNELDLTRKELPKPETTKQTAKLTLDLPATVDVEAGAKKAINVRIKRENFKGDVKISFAGAPPGGKMSDLTIPADKEEGKAELDLPKDAKTGPVDVTVKADAGVVKTQGKIKLSVKAAPPPPTASKMVIAAPGAPVDVEAGGKKVFEIKISGDNLKNPVKLAFRGLPAGITITGVSVSNDNKLARVEVSAAKDAKPGQTEVSVTATGDTEKDRAETKFKIDVKPGPKDKAKDK